MTHLTPETTTPPRRRSSGLTLRAVLLGALLGPVMGWWNISVETIRYAGQPSTVSLYPHVLFVLLCLVGLNALVARRFPGKQMSPSELLLVYFMALMAAVVSSHDIVEVMVPIWSYPARFANAANRWDTEIVAKLPGWLFVTDADAVSSYYVGNASLWNQRALSVWVRPVAIWTCFLTVLSYGMFCLNVLFRKTWMEHERLAFPLAQLPMDLVQPRVPLFTSRIFWLGFGITAALDMWYGAHSLWPAIPEPFPRFQTLDPYLTQPPWNSIGWLPLAFYPWIVGLGVMLPLDLLLSCTVFFWVWKLQPVVAAAYGYTDIPRFPFVLEQTAGGFAAIALTTLYTGRRALAESLRAVVAGTPPDWREALSPRMAWGGFLLSGAAVFAFFNAIGMAWWVNLFVLAGYLLIAVAAARIRAELGAPAHDPGGDAPMRVLTLFFGTDALRQTDMAAFVPLHSFNRGYRAHPMPTQMEGLYAGERSGVGMRGMFWALVAAVSIGALSGFLTNISLHYAWGAASKADPPFVSTIFGREPYEIVSNMMTAGVTPSERSTGTAAVGVGFLVTAVLGALRLSMSRFPLHPVGYAISSGWSMSLMWFSLLIALICKASLLKAGGLRAYRSALPVFMGIVLGDCAVGSLWMLVSIFTGAKSFIFWPYG
jgi:hypothetical protein